MKSKGKLVFSGALSLTLSALVVKILGVVYKIPLSYILSDVGMGYFNTAYTVYGFFYVLCSAGVPKAITCIIAEEEAKGNENAFLIYKFALRAFAIIGLAVSAIYLLLSPFIVRIISNVSAITTMFAIGPSILFVATGGVCRGYLSARNRLFPIALSQVIEAACKLVLGLLFAYLGVFLRLDLKYVSALAVLGITLGSLLSTLCLMIYAKKENTTENPRQKSEIDSSLLTKRIVTIAAPITISSSVLTLSNVLDMAVIMRCLSRLGYSNSAANEIYGNYTTLAVPMVNLIISLVAPLTVYLLPELIKHKIAGDTEELRGAINRVMEITMVFVCPCVFIFYFYSFDVLDILFTSVQSAKGYQMLALLSLGLVFLTALNVVNTAHEALGNYKIPILSLTIGSIVKLILEPVLILKSSAGLLGVPLSTVVSYLIGLLISHAFLGKQVRGIGVLRYGVLPFIASLICFAAPYFTVFSQGKIGQSSLGIVVLLSICCIAYVILVSLYFYVRLKVRKVKLNKKIDVSYSRT